MKIVLNSLTPVWDRWEDPGDYPSNAGAGPLPPGPWELVGIDGKLIVELTDGEMRLLVVSGFDAFVSEETEGIAFPEGVEVVDWNVERLWSVEGGYQIALTCDPKKRRG